MTSYYLDSEWKWEYLTSTEAIENCDQNRFGSKPISFWAENEPRQDSSQYKFGRLTVNKYEDKNNWSAGTGYGGTHVGYVCGPFLNQGRTIYFFQAVMTFHLFKSYRSPIEVLSKTLV